MTVRRPGWTRLGASALFILVLLVLAPLGASSPALAGQLAKSSGQKAPSGSGYITFGIQPSGPRQPDKRSWFIYALKPGVTIQDWVAITNFSLTPLRINLYARDAVESPSGAFAVQLFRQRPVQVGSWIHLPVSSVVVDPDKAFIVPFTIKVPQDASPGDHAGGIVASVFRTTVGGHGARIRVEQRVGLRVYARIVGPLRPKLVISVASHYAGTWSPVAGGTLIVTSTVRNAGNLDLSAPSVLRLTNPFGWSRTVRQRGNPPDLLPGFSVQVTRVVHGVYPAFRIDSTVTVHPGFSTVSTDSGLNETSLRLGSVSASTGTWTIPWSPLGLLLLLILVVLGSAIYIRSRRRRADRRAHAEPPRGEAVPV
ncbi:MAG: WxL protein peptidoglycan domain-containing protein [Acidimicrobiales bacterium]